MRRNCELSFAKFIVGQMTGNPEVMPRQEMALSMARYKKLYSLDFASRSNVTPLLCAYWKPSVAGIKEAFPPLCNLVGGICCREHVPPRESTMK